MCLIFQLVKQSLESATGAGGSFFQEGLIIGLAGWGWLLGEASVRRHMDILTGPHESLVVLQQ